MKRALGMAHNKDEANGEKEKAKTPPGINLARSGVGLQHFRHGLYKLK